MTQAAIQTQATESEWTPAQRREFVRCVAELIRIFEEADDDGRWLHDV